MRNVGVNGYSWSSTVTGSGNYFLDFNYSGILPNNGNHCTYGFQTRCLQE
ncbi:MAG: hypothetical protein K2G93_03260 [Rikenella sp.]|nr:hypothetical protein [Rikenella sp.]